MIELQKNDLHEVLNLSRIALECDTLGSLQKNILLEIQHMVHADTSVYFDVSRTTLGWQFTNGISHGVPKEAPKTWCDKYQTMDPFVFLLSSPLQSRNKQVLTSRDIAGSTDYVDTEFYHDFLKPQSIFHMMAVGLTTGSGLIGLLGLHRSAKGSAFSRKSIAKVSTIVPYISAAVQKIKLAEMTDIREELIRTLTADLNHRGLVILNQDFLPVFLDKKTRNILNIPIQGGHEIVKPLTNLLPPEIGQTCMELKSKASAFGTRRDNERIHFEVQHAGGHLTGYLYAYQPRGRDLHFVICLDTKAGHPSEVEAFSEFHLTPREIEVAYLISAGLTNPEIAEKLYISIRTVQAHLRTIYRKVKVHNRTSLVSRLMLDHRH